MSATYKRPARRGAKVESWSTRWKAVEAWVGELGQRFGHRPIAVAVEQVKGALVFMLNKYECLHIFSVPSTMSASLHNALYPSGAKDDPRDSDLLLDLLLQHRDKLHRLSPDNEATRRVQHLVEERRKLVEERTAQGNRLTGYLKIYFPQMLEWFEKVDTELVCAPLERWPRLEELQKASAEDCGRSSASTAVIENSWNVASWRSAERFRPLEMGR